MGRIKVLENIIRHYAWGSPTAIPELLNISSPSGRPCAELWMGAHPAAPSRVTDGETKVNLDRFIRNHPNDILGKRVADKFGDTLPFLFKVLAASEPLSIQAHPDKNHARDGFARENRAGIPPGAPERNYRDPNHKPECICALTPFSALCGFRSPSEISDNMAVVIPGYEDLSMPGTGKKAGSPELKDFFHKLLVIDPQKAKNIIARAVDEAVKRAETDPMCRWIIQLHRTYPDDIMVLAPVFMNLIELSPRQALFLPAGVLHAYLEGVGMELMANSDNVLRGGLTPKHIAVAELLGALDFSPLTPRILSPVYREGCEGTYETPAEEFVLSVMRVIPGRPCSPDHQDRVSILLCLDGQAVLTDADSGEITTLTKGVSVLIPASVSRWSLSGEALIYKASATC